MASLPFAERADDGEDSDVNGMKDERTASGASDVSDSTALVLVVGLLAVPMTVVPSSSGGPTFVTLWGFIGAGLGDPTTGPSAYPVWSYFADRARPFGTLPTSIQVWPVAIGFHLLAVASAAGGVAFGREDRRVTGGLLVLAALATLWVSVGVAGRVGVGRTAGWVTVIPTGALATISVAIGLYGADLRDILRR
ncbi:TIGR04206 family protein [Halorubrum sp. DTA98]|uniref:TIGR04206 family protein n=1 Tax=Halorubrum sp. DTA98 TaxID=3402163 RepID=UPI003AADE46E